MAILYLLPAYLGETSPKDIFSLKEIDLLKEIKFFVAENQKSARKFVKFLCPEITQSELSFSILDKRTSEKELEYLSKPLKEGKDIIPITGPSSIILALIASGLNGQNFAFNGYLPIDAGERKKAILNLEKISKTNGSSQIFMETPYRNQSLFDNLIKYLNPNTFLCIATNVTLPNESIRTLYCKEWRTKKPKFHKEPTIFIIQS